MDIYELGKKYESLLRPVFGDNFRLDDSEADKDWLAIILDGGQEDFIFSLYGTGCVRLYWQNECFIFDKRRDSLVSSDTYGEIVYEEGFDEEALPGLVAALILQLKDCTYIGKTETVKGKTLFGYDDIKDYLVTAKTANPPQRPYRLGNITITYEK
ncbi:MAG: hypothetical protein HFE45_05535 [Oscillospiraceae bacterium]|jgi:hypothetical protein|nr:hypothetical protein [Oscillospiraceae bacterium]